MEYEVLYVNDDQVSAKVRMTIDGNILEQDFLLGDNFVDDILQGMAVLKSEIDRRPPIQVVPQVDHLLNVTTVVKNLPVIDPKDNLVSDPIDDSSTLLGE